MICAEPVEDGVPFASTHDPGGRRAGISPEWRRAARTPVARVPGLGGITRIGSPDARGPFRRRDRRRADGDARRAAGAASVHVTAPPGVFGRCAQASRRIAAPADARRDGNEGIDGGQSTGKLFEAVLQLLQVVLDGLPFSGRECWEASWQES